MDNANKRVVITPEIREYLNVHGLPVGDEKVYPATPSDHALRGTPVVGRGRSSAITGSQPERALLRKEAKGRLFVVPRDPLPAPEGEVRPRTRKKLGRRVIAPGGRTW